MPRILSWSNSEALFSEVHEAYVEMVSDALGVYLRVLRTQIRDFSTRIEMAIEKCSDEAFLRVVLAPETVARLLFFGLNNLCESATFLNDAFQAELLLETDCRNSDRELWTALGDIRIVPGVRHVPRPCPVGRIPVDFDSPHGRSFESQKRDLGGSRIVLGEEERNLALDRLSAAYRLLSDVGLTKFVSQFTKVIVLTRDDARGFSSGSETRYIGRSELCNLHNSGIDHFDVAEALVHESIHSILYMEERRRPWVPAALYAPIPRVVSPWSGRVLPLRPFLQACFVWYGIAQFWGKTATTANFPPDAIAERLARSTRGFLGPLLRECLLQEDVDAISPEVLAAIAEMQNVVKYAAV
jgi:hypothetical protein